MRHHRRDPRAHASRRYVYAAAALLCWPCTVALGVPALSEPFTLTQPDGSTFVARLGGDEWFNWTSCEGNLIVRDRQGWWRYAEQRKGNLYARSARAGVDPVPAEAATLAVAPALSRAAAPRPEHTRASEPIALNGPVTRPVLVVLVEFQDRTAGTTDEYWKNLFFGTSGNTVRNYYLEVSGGDLTLTPAAETAGTVNDGIVRVQLGTADHNGGNHPDPDDVIDDRNRWIVYDALYRTDPYVLYSAFDTDVNWTLTPDELHIVVVVAGYERGFAAGWTPAVYAHRWALGFTHSEYVPAVQCDFVTLCGYNANPAYDSGYCQVGELHGDHSATVGVSCHEMGHDMGLPDLYDTTYNSSGIGAYGVMGFGTWGQALGDAYIGPTPTHMCAWSKAQLGFVTPTVASVNAEYTLPATGSTSYSVIQVKTQDPNQYFLIENRQLQGFDAGLYRWFSLTSGGAAGGGLAVWHIDESIADNDNAAHKKVDLEEAAAASLDDPPPSPPGDPVPLQGNREHYYYAGHVGDFGDATTPNSRLYDATVTNINVSSVSSSGTAMKCFIASSLQATLEWCTYLGYTGDEYANDLALDSNENVYVTGALGYYHVVKLDPNGSFVYGADLGSATAEAIAVDSVGCAYVTGQASEWFMARPSPDYSDPPPYVYDYTYNGGGYGMFGDAHVTKVKADGSGVHYASFLGGSADLTWPTWGGVDAGHGIDVDSAGQAVVTGMTDSKDFPETEGSAYGHYWDGFVTKFNAAGTGLIYSRYLSEGVPLHGYPGTLDEGFDVACDAGGNAWVVGRTFSEDFDPVLAYPSGFDTTIGGIEDAFIVKISTTGGIAAASYLGGSSIDESYAVAVDTLGYPYATGLTHSTSGFPLVNPFDNTNSYYADGDTYITVPNTSATSVTYSTFFGGYVREEGRAIDVDSQYNMVLAGFTTSDDCQVSGGAISTTRAGGKDAFVAKLLADGATLELGTYLGGTGDDEARGVGIGGSGAIYVAGITGSSDFPTTPGAYDPNYNGGVSDAFVAKITLAQQTDSVIVLAPDGGETWCVGATAPIRWSSSGTSGNVKIELSRNGVAGTWETLYASTADDGAEDWPVTAGASTNCYIRISDTDGSPVDVSNAAFAIASCAPGDFDGDGDVDLDDYAAFEQCLAGPDVSIGVGCETGDFDDDDDVDLKDAVAFWEAFTG